MQITIKKDLEVSGDNIHGGEIDFVEAIYTNSLFAPKTSGEEATGRIDGSVFRIGHYVPINKMVSEYIEAREEILFKYKTEEYNRSLLSIIYGENGEKIYILGYNKDGVLNFRLCSGDGDADDHSYFMKRVYFGRSTEMSGVTQTVQMQSLYAYEARFGVVTFDTTVTCNDVILRAFPSFPLSTMWDYAKKTHDFVSNLGGNPLPVSGKDWNYNFKRVRALGVERMTQLETYPTDVAHSKLTSFVKYMDQRVDKTFTGTIEFNNISVKDIVQNVTSDYYSQDQSVVWWHSALGFDDNEADNGTTIQKVEFLNYVTVTQQKFGNMLLITMKPSFYLTIHHYNYTTVLLDGGVIIQNFGKLPEAMSFKHAFPVQIEFKQHETGDPDVAVSFQVVPAWLAITKEVGNTTMSAYIIATAPFDSDYDPESIALSFFDLLENTHQINIPSISFLINLPEEE